MPELLTSEVLRNICRPLQLLAMTIPLTYPPVAAHPLVLATVIALLFSTGKIQYRKNTIDIVFLCHCFSPVLH